MSAESLRRPLLVWYARSKRALPWRADTDPYRVMVSELMLQQTQVKTVLPYYARFIKRFPTAKALASAEEQEVLAAWAGLGYYRRARFLQRAAAAVAKNGFPDSIDGLKGLPGIGDYTAAAIGSISFGLPAAVVDGNVIRVISRVLAMKQDAKSAKGLAQIKDFASAWLDPVRPGDHNQAVMELGALLCTPKAPDCNACPLKAACKAKNEGRPEAYPVLPQAPLSIPVRKSVALVSDGAAVLMAQRDDPKGRMQGYWHFPETELEDGVDAEAMARRQAQKAGARGLKSLGPCGRFDHSITKYRIHVAAFRFESDERRPVKPWQWVELGKAFKLPLASAEKKILHFLSHPLET